MSFKVLVLFPGRTTTRIGLFTEDSEITRNEIRHDKGELSRFKTITGQWGHRLRAIEESLAASDGQIRDVSADAVVVPACSSLKLPGGVYAVDSGFLEKTKKAAPHECPLDLGPALAEALAGARNAKAFAVASSISSDELEPFSVVTGLPELTFSGATDILNVQASLHRFSGETESPVSGLSVIVADLGENFLICSCREGRVVDLSDSNERGPFSLSKSGSVPAAQLVSMAYSGMWSIGDLTSSVNVRGGVESYIESGNLDEVMKRYEDGDVFAGIVAKNLAYQTAQEISAQAAVLHGKVDAVILTGICAENTLFVELVMERIRWIPGTKVVYPGEDDLRSMAGFAVSVLSGREEALICGRGFSS
ncbi:MAG: butyrate kinase [Synergistaceae bacterium]|jgi:butyrate kinase|nr:butyrate kinase [Synergistaceae bacterium]